MICGPGRKSETGGEAEDINHFKDHRSHSHEKGEDDQHLKRGTNLLVQRGGALSK